MKKITYSLIALLSFATAYAAMPGGDRAKCKNTHGSHIQCKLSHHRTVELNDNKGLDSLYNSSKDPNSNEYILNGIRYPKGVNPAAEGLDYIQCEPGFSELF